MKHLVKKVFKILGYEIKRIGDNFPRYLYKIPDLKIENKNYFMDEYERYTQNSPLNLTNHHAGSFPNKVLKELEKILPASIENSAETGCGKSTILFSNISNNHTVFALDDSQSEDSSIKFFTECSLTNMQKIKTVFGPTQQTLKNYSEHTLYDVVLLDGPHGYPFPDFEYLIFYPLIRENGYLIIDDVHIPTIGRMADVIAEDQMWNLIAVIETTAVLQRTQKEAFSNKGDGWWTQLYNRRRFPQSKKIFIKDGGKVVDKISSLYNKAR